MKSQALRAYQRRTLAVDALIAGSYLAGTNTRRVRRALAALFGGAVGKDTALRQPAGVPGIPIALHLRIVRLILDGTVVRHVRLTVSTGICSRTRPSACTRRSLRITTT